MSAVRHLSLRSRDAVLFYLRKRLNAVELLLTNEIQRGKPQ